MIKISLFSIWLVLVLITAVAQPVVSTANEKQDEKQVEKQVERGKYLIDQVAMCADCHTPRNERGELDKTRWMQGGPLDFKPVQPIPNWAENAPAIASFGNRGSGWSEEQAVKLFETGLGPNGKPLRPPMPAYKMTHEDASAVVAYLKTLKRVRVR